jgi:hypothetical protein
VGIGIGFNDNPRSSARRKFKGLKCAAASADDLSGGGSQTFLPIQGRGSTEPFFIFRSLVTHNQRPAFQQARGAVEIGC